MEILLPADDPVCLLSMFVEEMELSNLYQTVIPHFIYIQIMLYSVELKAA